MLIRKYHKDKAKKIRGRSRE